jgi:hypothetical protein
MLTTWRSVASKVAHRYRTPRPSRSLDPEMELLVYDEAVDLLKGCLPAGIPSLSVFSGAGCTLPIPLHRSFVEVIRHFGCWRCSYGFVTLRSK